MKRKYLILASILFLLGCSKGGLESSSSSSSAKNEERLIHVHYDYGFSSDFESVIDKSDLIVTGYYGDVVSKWNQSRDVNNSDLESKDFYTEGLIYNFTIEEVLYSSDDFNEKTIPVNLRHFERIDVTLDDGSIEYVDHLDPYYIEPSTSQKYTLLLSYNPQFDLYFKASEPFQFTVHEDELTVTSNLFNENQSNVTKHKNITVQGPSFVGIEDQFSGTKIEEIERLIKELKK